MELLPLAELLYNYIFQESIQQTLFFVNSGHHPKFDPFDFKIAKNPLAEDLTKLLLDVHHKMKLRL